MPTSQQRDIAFKRTRPVNSGEPASIGNHFHNRKWATIADVPETGGRDVVQRRMRAPMTWGLDEEEEAGKHDPTGTGALPGKADAVGMRRN